MLRFSPQLRGPVADSVPAPSFCPEVPAVRGLYADRGLLASAAAEGRVAHRAAQRRLGLDAILGDPHQAAPPDQPVHRLGGPPKGGCAAAPLPLDARAPPPPP